MKVSLLVLAALLAGCTTRTVTVEVPVPCRAPALERPAIDGWDRLPAEAPIDDQVLALLGDRIVAGGYIDQLEAAITACR